MRQCRRSNAGFSFIEALITIAIVVIVFGGLLSSIQFTAKLIGHSKAKAGANALATERMEYIRSLDYDSVGTEGGVPSGNLPQATSTTLNGVTYFERLLVEYVDDEADGFGAEDENAILADYKRVKVEYSWNNRGATSSVELISNIIPPGIETTEGGGTIKVNVFDASVLPVSGASVRFVNNTLDPAIDTTRYTNVDGVVYLSGAPEGADYEIYASKSDYSSDGTVTPSVENPNPTTPPIAVVESSISTMNFQIDLLSNLNIFTVGEATTNSFTDTFANGDLSESIVGVDVSEGEAHLAIEGPGYYTSGSFHSTTTAPVSFTSWESANFNATTTANSNVLVSVYYDTGSGLALVPDVDLPGNSSGFSTSPIDLSALDTVTYSGLSMKADFTTSDIYETATLYDWELSYVVSEPPEPNISYNLSGSKVIGSNGSTDILKYENSGTTDANGEDSLTELEWDTYQLDITSDGYTIKEMCPWSPFALDPGVTLNLKTTLIASVSPALHVLVADVDGNEIPGANVQLTRGTYDETQVSSLCGQTLFSGGGLTTANDYTLDVSASGYVAEQITNVEVGTNSHVTVILTSS